MNEEVLTTNGDDDDDNPPPREWVSDEERAAAMAAEGEAAAAADAEQQLEWADVAEASAKADEAKSVKPPRVRKVTIAGVERVLGKDEHTTDLMIDVPIAQESRIAMVREMVASLDRKRELEEALKDHIKVAKGQIAELDQRARSLGRTASVGVEPRLVACVVVRDDRLGEMQTVRADTGEVVARRAMTYQERQLGLSGVETPSDDAPPPEDPKETRPETPRAKRQRRSKQSAIDANGAVT